MNHQENLTKYVAAFVDKLVKTGVKDVVISPGSRSTPMALLMAEHPQLKTYINIDERSAAFFALGIAKASRLPVALLCTSGTAAANYYPAVIEAKLSRVPLIVLTADRPHELRDIGAPQAIDQIHLYGEHVKWFSEMALPEGNVEMIDYAKVNAARAVTTALQAPAGPVHLNFPFREPLMPKLDPSPFLANTDDSDDQIVLERGNLQLNEQTYESIAKQLSDQEGVIICGVIDKPTFVPAVIKLAEKLNYPIIADPLSQLRSGEFPHEHIIDSYDAMLRDERTCEYLTPSVVIRFGGMPVSKPLTRWLKNLRHANHYIVDGGHGWRDPGKMATHMIACDETAFCKNVAANIERREEANNWLTKWKKINEIAKREVKIAVEKEDHLEEGKVAADIIRHLPHGSTLFVGNSMPIRDVDTFFHSNKKNVRILGNRGANGIDGVVSTSLGASIYEQQMYLMIGDLSFFHDLNGLHAAKTYGIHLTILLINNNGGGIFSYLPQAEDPKHFEMLFGTPLDLQFKHAVDLYGGNYQKVNSLKELHRALNEAPKQKGINVIEIPTNRQENVIKHRHMWRNVSEEIHKYICGEEE